MSGCIFYKKFSNYLKCIDLATDGQSVVLTLSLSETHDQILAVVKKVVVLLSWGIFRDRSTDLSRNRSQSLSVSVTYMFFHTFNFLHHILDNSTKLGINKDVTNSVPSNDN
jgi:hypothetical protein